MQNVPFGSKLPRVYPLWFGRASSCFGSNVQKSSPFVRKGKGAPWFKVQKVRPFGSKVQRVPEWYKSAATFSLRFNIKRFNFWSQVQKRTLLFKSVKGSCFGSKCKVKGSLPWLGSKVQGPIWFESAKGPHGSKAQKFALWFESAKGSLVAKVEKVPLWFEGAKSSLGSKVQNFWFPLWFESAKAPLGSKEPKESPILVRKCKWSPWFKRSKGSSFGDKVQSFPWFKNSKGSLLVRKCKRFPLGSKVQS